MTGFERSRAVVPELVVVERSGSTNAELLARAAAAPHLATLVTTDQTAGRGRLGRVWTAPPGSGLAISVLLRPRLPGGAALDLDRFGWFPLAAGVAMSEAVADALPAARVALKWPNDVLVGGRKICGILAELAPTGDAVVVGAGLNVSLRADDLPVPTATSLAIEGAPAGPRLADEVLAGYLERLAALVGAYLAAGGDADASGLRARARAACGTLGTEVRVELPGDERLVGTATDLDATGRLVVVRTADGVTVPVAAGDVTHLR